MHEGNARLTRTPTRYSSPSVIPPRIPLFQGQGKRTRKGLRFPFFRAGTTQFRKNASRFPCVHIVNFTVFTSENTRAPDRVNMDELGRPKRGFYGLACGRLGKGHFWITLSDGEEFPSQRRRETGRNDGTGQN